MVGNIYSQVVGSDPLISLVQKENFVGWIYSIDYDKALVITNDDWKDKVRGIPHNCFLLAATLNPESLEGLDEMDKEVVLLRVVGSCKLPQDDDMIRTKIDNYKNQTSVYLQDSSKDIDPYTKNNMQFGGLECRVLGTFHIKDQNLYLGSDIESFSMSMRMSVYRPKGESLSTIVNYIDPIRKKKSKEDFVDLGITQDIKPFKIGTVRYTSSDRLHRGAGEELVSFSIQPADFLARRTAVLGMTRTGKSNMIKQLVSVVKNISDDAEVNIGQIIYDINGEYANANQQDKGAISEVFKDECVRYRLVDTPGFIQVKNNFYTQIEEGHQILSELITEKYSGASLDRDIFTQMSLEKPSEEEFSEIKRWKVKIAIYKALLHKVGFKSNRKGKLHFEANKSIREAVDSELLETAEYLVGVDPKGGLEYADAVIWFSAARSANNKSVLKSSSGKEWLDTESEAMLNLLCQKSKKDTHINGYKALTIGLPYHSESRDKDVFDEVYEFLKDGKIVILDLSVGPAFIRDKISKKIAKKIFDNSMGYFIKGENPPNIVIYVEEAHNLIGKGLDLTETWPRLAKEGAKYRISLVYATQEVSSVHPNILSNTENWFVSHLNSEREVKEISKFYDFSDFSKSLLRAQDVGFSRVKTLSGPFVVPVQIDKFNPRI